MWVYAGLSNFSPHASTSTAANTLLIGDQVQQPDCLPACLAAYCLRITAGCAVCVPDCLRVYHLMCVLT